MEYDLRTRDIAQLVKYLPPMQEVAGSVLTLHKWGCGNECLQSLKPRQEDQSVRPSLTLW